MVHRAASRPPVAQEQITQLMGQRKILLQHKVLIGYLALMAIITGMVAVLFHERSRVAEIESETVAIRRVHRDANTIQRHISVLASYGETVLSWAEEDFDKYRTLRLRTDSLLQAIHDEEFVRKGQIDTLRNLLASKETHLVQIMRLFRKQSEADSLLSERLPAAVRAATRSRTITHKKKGVPGWFGAKETVQLPPDTGTLQSLNEELRSMQEERQKDMDSYADSLRVHNMELNRELRILIATMDAQFQSVLAAKEEHLKASHDRSTFTITCLVLSAVFLLLVSYLVILRDIKVKDGHRKRMEVILKKLQENIEKNKELTKAQRRIIQTITHELRTPLAAIAGNAELIERDDETERLRHLSSILQSAGRMSSLLDNLMNYFRLDNGKETADPKPFQLKNIGDTLHIEFAPQAEAKQLVFQVKNCEDEVVVGDKDLILRIGSNLLSNAVKFTERGMISLSVSYGNNVFTMTVEDTGSGISEEQQKRIYRPFERLTNAATQDGFGLGLPIVRELVAMMKGEISLESVPGKGSRFSVRLPLERAEETIAAKENAPTLPILCNIFVLVLDNDEVLLTMTRDMLTRQKIDCDTCRNVHELLERMRGRNYDLLITDLKMPDMNGYEVMELLRTSDIGNSRNIPIIVSTAMDRSAEAELLAAGFCGCLFKPFSSDEAARAIASCIDRPEQQQKINLSILLAYGNKEEILERLINETEKEMEQMREAFEKKDMAELDTLIHHLRSSWMLLNADRPLRELYDLIHQPQYDKTSLDEKVQAVLRNGENIIRLAQKTKEGLWER